MRVNVRQKEGELRFSERMGFRSARAALQLDGIDKNLRTALFNALHAAIVRKWYDREGQYSWGRSFGQRIWTEFWRRPVHQFDDSSHTFETLLSTYCLEAPWYDVYDLVEYVMSMDGVGLREDAVNSLLERDMAGYRMRRGCIVPITDEIELATIDEAFTTGDAFKAARDHLADALDKLARRPQPDVRNAITEAVSAVESAARVVTGKRKATLGDALKILEQHGHLHPALKDAWSKLYGYTSDEEGLRHAMTSEPNIDFATAKYMVVTCAAFVNLLAANS